MINKSNGPQNVCADHMRGLRTLHNNATNINRKNEEH